MFWITRPKVFICHVPGSSERVKWLLDVVERWKQLGAKPELLMPFNESNLEFQRSRRIRADQLGGKYYILADDDCLPEGRRFIRTGFEILKRHKQFSALSPLPSNERIVEWTPSREEQYTVISDTEVFEHVSIGGIRFCRRGSIALWPPVVSELPGYDWLHGLAARRNGYRVGYMRHLRFEHLGAGKSSVWPVHA
jgi:hypothetical protein